MSETLSAIISGARRAARVPALYIGLSGDRPRTPPARMSLADVDVLVFGRGERRTIERRREQGMDTAVLALPDSRMSSRHARLTRVGATWVIEDLSSKNGTWVEGDLVTSRELDDGDVVLVGHTAIVFREIGGELPDLDGAPTPQLGELTTLSPELAASYGRLATAATSNLPIQISGETGTGKELVARAVHAASGRKGRFVAINCAAIAPALLEGELFGNRRGAYTGATDDRTGLIRAADGGTLFLDEIAELPASAQAALLRVLQEGEVMPVGGDRAVKVDVRLVSATHKALDAEVAAERFRADLRARLLGVACELPPLRARLEDLGLIAATLLDRHGASPHASFAADVVSALYVHPWPLNVRELERVIYAATTLSQGLIELEHLPEDMRRKTMTAELASLSDTDRKLRDTLVAAVQKHAGNLAAVARELGKDAKQIRRWMTRFGVERPRGG